MSWFEEQLKARRRTDEENFEESLGIIADSVMGKRTSNAIDSTEITQSALEEILRYFHLKYREEEQLDTKPTLEEHIENVMSPFGVQHRRVHLDKGWHKHAAGPMIGTLKEDGTVVALIPNKLVGYRYVDPVDKTIVGINNAKEALIDDEAICFYQPLPPKALGIKDLTGFMLNQLSVGDIVLYIGMTAIITLLGMLAPKITNWLLGDVLKQGNYNVLAALTVFIVCYNICKLCVSSFVQLLNSKMTNKLGIAVEAAVMGRIINLPVHFFRDYAAGELYQRSMYVQALCTTVMSTVGTIGISSLFSLIYIGQIFKYARVLVWPSIIIALATIGINLLTTFRQIRITEERMLNSTKTSGLTYSTITGIQKIKLAGAEKRMFARWAKTYAKEAKLEYNPPIFLKISPAIVLAISLFGDILLYFLAVESRISVADYYAFNTAYAMVLGGLTSFESIVTGVANIQPTMKMAEPILKAVPEFSEKKQIVHRLSGLIEIQNVSFRYESDMPNVIDNLSLRIKPGEYVAIVGSTGCGKSTLMRLLLGFEKPQSGAIYYDQKDIAKLDMKSLRQHIGTVMQDGKLFAADIFANIVISSPGSTLDDAWEAAETAAIADDIRRMPMGMNTMICEGQGGISGGQRQRLMIARAVCSKPTVLMFDEATSALDNISQRKVSESIDSLSCTRVVIAHRLSTIRHADRIVCLDKGKIVEEGTYDELLAKKGFFAELVERQIQ